MTIGEGWGDSIARWCVVAMGRRVTARAGWDARLGVPRGACNASERAESARSIDGRGCEQTKRANGNATRRKRFVAEAVHGRRNRTAKAFPVERVGAVRGRNQTQMPASRMTTTRSQSR